jgi:hypothetical protein
VIDRLNREFRINPQLTLVTQQHFLGKVQGWAKEHKVLVECVEGPTRYTANEALLFSGAGEYLVFPRDRYIDHLVFLLGQSLDKPLVRLFL